MTAGGDENAVLTAPELILSLLDSAPQPRLSAANLVAAGGLLGIDAGAIRVAAGRLMKKGVLRQETRGLYRVGDRGDLLHRRVQGWRDVEGQTVPWDGRWLAVLCGHLSRSNKSLLRGRERALRLKGFAWAATGLAVRPANLRLSQPELRRDLEDLGLDPDALLVRLDAEDPGHRFDPAGLWDVAGMERRYADNCTRLERSTAGMAALDVQSAARETLLLGRAVMRDILVDPLLPEAMIDTVLRCRMIDAMVVYDRLGKACWRTFYESLNG